MLITAWRFFFFRFLFERDVAAIADPDRGICARALIKNL